MGTETIDRRQKRSKSAFRKAFVELLSEKELSKITVSEIAERADRNRKTFYLHYDSIDAFVDEILREEMAKVVDVIGEISVKEGGKIDVPKLFEVLSSEFMFDFDERASIMRYIDTDRMIMRLRPMLTEAIVEQDLLGLANTLGPYLEPFVAYFCAGLLALYHHWAVSESEIPIEHLSELAGITTAGGIAALTTAAGAAK